MLIQKALDKATEALFPDAPIQNNSLDGLLESTAIDKTMYDIYLLFEMNEIGRRFLKDCMMYEYLNEPELKNNALAYQEGRRSIFRHLNYIISQINNRLNQK